jgi:hypothetical protein
MSFGIFAKTTNDGKFIDFVCAEKGRKNVRRVNMTQINAQKKVEKPSTRETMNSSLRIALLDLDYHSRRGATVHRDWKSVAKKVEGYSRIGG